MLHVNDSQKGQLVDYLVIAGLLSGLISMLMYGHQLAATAFLGGSEAGKIDMMPFSYKLFKVIEISCVLCAGFLSYSTENRFSVPRRARILMWVLFFWSFGHAWVAFKDGFTLSEPIGSKGPVVWWSLIFLFAGISKQRWKIIYPIVIFVVVVGSFDMIYGIVSLGGIFNRNNAVLTLRVCLTLLLWTAPLIFLVPQKKISMTILTFVPLLILGIGALMTATRSWVVIFFLYSITFLFRYLKTLTSAVTRVVTVYGLIIVFCIGVYTVYTIFDTQVSLATNIFSQRISTDTRTKQLQLFFERVPLIDLIVGTGPRGTWKMNDSGPEAEYGYVDGPYLLMLFVGGIPLLLSYSYLVVYPFIKSFFIIKSLNIDYLERACINIGVIWALALTGFATFTFPTLYVSHYIILLCAGRCWGILSEQNSFA